jgi:hypothetical protein
MYVNHEDTSLQLYIKEDDFWNLSMVAIYPEETQKSSVHSIK